MKANPKLQRDAAGVARLYRYYAGYSETFVRETLETLGLTASSTLLDPWNGAGTTTSVAQEIGVPSIGFDLNPAMSIVAKAKLVDSSIAPSHLSLAEVIFDYSRKGVVGGDHDPLSAWFQGSSIHHIRGLEYGIQKALTVASPGEFLSVGGRLADLSTIGAFFYLALFRTVRYFLARFQTSNPTWIRHRKGRETLIDLQASTVEKCYRKQVALMFGITLRSDPRQLTLVDVLRGHQSSISARIGTSSSTALPLDTASVDAVVSSPPYCTRLDYAVATRPELAVLGLSKEAFRKLREQLIGTTTVPTDVPSQNGEWGSTCATLLKRIATHASKASGGYYVKNYSQYFEGLYKSLREIGRVARPKAPCVIVVQDSYYKDVHVDLPAIVTDMGRVLGWNRESVHNFKVKHLLANSHKHSSSYRSRTDAVESVMTFRTG